jgi:prephenate dehydrogenase (NADP+)
MPKLQPYRCPGYIVLTLVTWDIQAWSDCISFGDFESYRDRFERTQRYFAPRFPEAVRLGNEMMKTILEKTTTESA